MSSVAPQRDRSPSQGAAAAIAERQWRRGHCGGDGTTMPMRESRLTALGRRLLPYSTRREPSRSASSSPATPLSRKTHDPGTSRRSYLMTRGPGPQRHDKLAIVAREGPFWDAMEGRAALPPAGVTLGWELVSVDPEQGTIEVAFIATDAFLNPAGVVQGGFLAAMLDDTLGPALVAGLDPGDFAPTIDLHVQFLRPARPGRLFGRGRVVRRGRDIAFLAGELVDDEGVVLAIATATAQIKSKML